MTHQNDIKMLAKLLPSTFRKQKFYKKWVNLMHFWFKQRVESWKWRSKCGTTQSLSTTIFHSWNVHIQQNHGGTLADLHRKCDTFQLWELVQQQGQHTLVVQNNAPTA